MNKNKKLVALICAMSMIFSVFAGFSIVSAAEITKGIAIASDASGRTTDKAVIVAKAAGFEKVDTYTISFALPSGATAKATSALISGGTENDGSNGGVYTYTCASAEEIAVPADGVLAVIEITGAGSDAFDVTLTGASGIACGKDKVSLERNNMVADATSVDEFTDPNATPKPTPIATRAPKPTAKPIDPVGPTKEPVKVEKGIDIEYDAANSTEAKAVIVAKAVGFEKVDTYTVSFALPTGATAKATSALIAGGTENDGSTGGVYTYTCASAEEIAVPADGVLAVVEIALASPLASDYELVLVGAAGIACGKDKVSLERNNMAADWVAIPAAGNATPEPTKEPEKSAAVTLPDVKITTDKIPANTDNLYIAVSVKTKDGNDAVYGKDYNVTLKLPDGTVKALTEEEMGYILNGYFDLVPGAESMTWADVINGLKFNVFSDGVTVAAQLLDGDVIIAGDESTVTLKPGKATPAPKVTIEGKSAGKKTTTVVVGKVITLTAKAENIPDGVEGEWSYEMDEKDAEKYLEPYGMTIKDDGSAQMKLEGIATKTSVPVTFKYIDKADGETVIAQGTVKVKVSKESTTSGGSGSNDSNDNSGNGTIARPGIQTPNAGVIAFSDIDTVPWAEDAILALVQRGVINGRDNVTFDPNGTVTRAEFAKMVVLGFGLTGGAAGNFSDVATTDWYNQYVQVGYANGVISGYDDGTFRPNGLITRQEMAAMISRAINAAGKTLPATVSAAAFTDVTDADWGHAEIAALQQGGVINGMTETTYEPQSNATRAQAAVIIYRAITKAL